MLSAPTSAVQLPNVSAKERSVEGSKVFFKEIVGINKTQDWEALPHEVALGKDLSIKLVNLYKSIPNLTWQPINYAFPSIESPKYTITKVAQMKKLFSYAINDDEVDTVDLDGKFDVLHDYVGDYHNE